MDSKLHATVDGDSIQVDPQLLFQRLLTAANSITENIPDIFRYELCNIPPSLFEPSGLLREANKPALADAIWKEGRGKDMAVPPRSEDKPYVLDGGSLLHRLPWPRGSTFDSVCKMYVAYVKQPVIICDGYITGPTTKNGTHL